MHWAVWALLSAVFAGLTAVLAKVGTTHLDSNLAMAIRTTVVLGLAWMVVWLVPRQPDTGLSARNMVFLILSGLATGASWLCYFKALSLGPASAVAPIDKLSVVFVILLAALFLGEALTWKQGFGVALIVAGSLFVAWK